MNNLLTLMLTSTLLIGTLPTQAVASMPISTRIVGGNESNAGDWPSIVSLQYTGITPYAGQFCGATLITNQWVVTAAHCMFKLNGNALTTAEFSAAVGQYDLNSTIITPTTHIAEIIVHPDYNTDTEENDIALLRLASPVSNEFITLLSQSKTAELIAAGDLATVIGWGSTVGYSEGDTPTPAYAEILREVSIPLNTDQQCSDSLGNSYKDSMICAAYPDGGKDSCQGDSGGPLMVETNSGWQQIGIVSWGFGCAAPGSPGVYTRIAYFDDWIDSKISEIFTVTDTAEFVTTPVNNTAEQLVTINNYSSVEANFSYQIEDSTRSARLADSAYFTFDASACTTIAAKSSCTFNVIYTPLDEEEHNAVITVSSDISGATVQKINLSGNPTVTTPTTPTTTSDSGGGSLGLFSLLLLPLVFIRRYYR